MGEQGQDRLERGNGTCGAAGQVEDQSGPQGSAEGPAERGERRLLEACEAHPFRETVDQALANDSGGLGGDIAGRKAGSTGSDDEVCGGGMAAEGIDDLVQFVRNCLHGGGSGACGAQTFGNGRAREVLLPAVEAAVADGENGGAGFGREAGVHRISLRALLARTFWDPEP